MVQIQRILCPVDFYPASERAVDYAVTLAKNYEARLTLLHVVAPILPTAYGVRCNLPRPDDPTQGIGRTEAAPSQEGCMSSWPETMNCGGLKISSPTHFPDAETMP